MIKRAKKRGTVFKTKTIFPYKFERGFRISLLVIKKQQEQQQLSAHPDGQML